MNENGGPENSRAAEFSRPRFVLPASALIPFGAIDEEHGVIIDLLNRAIFVVEQQGDTAVQSEALLATLRQHAADHFAHEEQAMSETNYPRLAEHQLHHHELLNRLSGFGKEGVQGGLGTVQMLEEFFAGFLNDVLNADLHFKTYLQSQGIIPG